MSFIRDIKHRFLSNETKQKVFSNLFWAVLGKIVNLLGSLLVGIIVARYLGPEKYGIMNYVISIVTIFQIFAIFGLDAIEIREEARKPDKRNVIIGTAFCIRILFAFLAIVAVAIYTLIFEDDIYISGLVLIYSISIILSTFNVARNHFTALVWNEYIVKTEISRTIVGLSIKVVLLMCKASLTWFVVSLVFDSVLLASGYVLSYMRKIDSIKHWTFNRDMAKYLISQSFPLLLSGAAIVIYQRVDQVMLGNMLNKSSVGMYSVAVRFVEVLIFIPTIISQTVSPLLVNYRQADNGTYKKNAGIFMNVTVWLCIVSALVLSFVSYPLVYYTFGVQYLPAVSVMAVMAFKVIGAALSQTSGQLIIIEEKQKWVSIRNIIGCVVCVVFNYIVIGRYGVIGAAYVSIITIVASGFIANLIIPQYRDIFRMQVLAIFVGWKDFINVKHLFK